MPKFKDSNGKIFEVTEAHADEVLRPQKNFEEVIVEEKPSLEVVSTPTIPTKKKSKKTAKKKTVRKS